MLMLLSILNHGGTEAQCGTENVSL